MASDEKRMELLSMSKKDLVERLIYAETLWIESVKKRDVLESRVAELEAEQSEIIQAFGLLTTLNPTMEIDTSDYMGMAKKIEKHVQELEATTFPKIKILDQETFLKEQREYIEDDWLEYPTNEPQDEGIKWYWVMVAGGRVTKACWWGHWYCFIEPVIAYKPIEEGN